MGVQISDNSAPDDTESRRTELTRKAQQAVALLAYVPITITFVVLINPGTGGFVRGVTKANRDFGTASKVVLMLEPEPYLQNLLEASNPVILTVKHDVERAPVRRTAELIERVVQRDHWAIAMFLHAAPRSEGTVLARHDASCTSSST